MEEIKVGEIWKDINCMYCEKQHTMDCPNSSKCYSLQNKPHFKLSKEYKSKLICKGKVFYNINHFNKFQKLLAKIIWRIKIEDIKE